MKLYLQSLVLAAVLLGGMSAAWAVGVLIDPFNPTMQTLDLPLGCASVPACEAHTLLGTQTAGEALGGVRKLQIQDAIVPSAVGNAAHVDTNTSNPPHLTFNTSSSRDGRLMMRWDGSNTTNGDTTANSLGGVDLTDGGLADRFRFIVSNLNVLLQAAITVCDATTTLCYTDEFLKPAPGDPQPPITMDENQDHFLSTTLTNFDNRACLTAGFGILSAAPAPCAGAFAAAAEAALENAGSVSLRLRADTGAVSIDLQLRQFETTSGVPEPATITLMGLGLVGVGIVAYRRRRQL